MIYINRWRIYTGSLRAIVKDELDKGHCDENDVVWKGPDGSAIIAPSPADLDVDGHEEYLDFVDIGQVKDYLD